MYKFVAVKDDGKLSTKMFLSQYQGFSVYLGQNHYNGKGTEYVGKLSMVREDSKCGDEWVEFTVCSSHDKLNINNVDSFVNDFKNRILLEKPNYLTKESRALILSIIKKYMNTILLNYKSLLKDSMDGCDFCLEFSELKAQEDSSSDVAIWIEDNKLHAQDYFECVYDINFCPMCGRKLHKD